MNYADLLNAVPAAGEALALRTRADESEYVIIGEVASVDLEDRPGPRNRVLEFAVDEFLHIDDGGVTPGREYLNDLPPIQPYLADDPKPAPLPALIYREDAPLGVSLPTPIWRGSRVFHYDTRPEGELVAFAHGEVVAPQDVLPPEVSTSEVIL